MSPGETNGPRWEQCLNSLNLISTVVLAIATVCLAIATFSLRDVAHSTDTTTSRQVELLDKTATLLKNQVQLLERNSFDQALEEAEKHCSSCSGEGPDYLIAIPLEKAIQAEPGAEELLVAAEYNRLTMLGSSVWDFEKTVRYAKKALEKSQTPLDKFFSNLVLGHVYFNHLDSDPDHVKLEDARKCFRAAIRDLQDKSGSERGQLHLGSAYGLWAQHEAFLKNEADCQHCREQARSTWSKLPTATALVAELDGHIQATKDGSRPEIACLFRRKEGLPTCAPRVAPAPAAEAPRAPDVSSK